MAYAAWDRHLGVCVPPPGAGVCATCRGPARDGAPECWCCRVVSSILGPDAGRCPVVVPVALFRTGDPLHTVLRGYKGAPGVAARRAFASSLVAHLSRFFDGHGPCLARALGTGWDSVAIVPSSTRRPADRDRLSRKAPHPLSPVVAAVPSLSGLARVAVSRGRARAGHLAPCADAFKAGAEAGGRRVLLLDDTWVTGARARSAAAALDRSGASVPAVVVAGRAVGAVDHAPAPGVARWWRWAEARGESLDRWRQASCCLGPCAVGRPG